MYMPALFNDSLFDDLFTDITDNKRRPMARPLPGVMKTDIKENDKEYELTIELPGYKKENVNAELKDGYLIINATNEKNEEEKDEKGYIRKERYFGSCSRSFFVGKNLKEEDIKAKFDNGVLTLNVPKEVEKLPEEKKYIAIEG
ncbi:Molecular chaperone IbpA, HSP20 family [Lachnospiraceae bacterium G41]|nr:Molecular chaperone IbpA, HSP20 family [Lachnospiraceae bacterium G41]